MLFIFLFYLIKYTLASFHLASPQPAEVMFFCLFPINHTRTHKIASGTTLCTWNVAPVVWLSFTHCVDTTSWALSPIKQSDYKGMFCFVKVTSNNFRECLVGGASGEIKWIRDVIIIKNIVLFSKNPESKDTWRRKTIKEQSILSGSSHCMVETRRCIGTGRIPWKRWNLSSHLRDE